MPRDVLIHQYDDVDVVEVWNTLTRDLPIGHIEPLAPRNDGAAAEP